MNVAVTLSSRDYDAVVSDLDGVLTRTARVPLGAPEDGPDVQSVRALGNLKDRYVLEQCGGRDSRMAGRDGDQRDCDDG